MEGWIKLHRKILESKYGKNVELLGLFTSLLLMANHKEGFTSDGTRVLPGQFMTSQKELAKKFKMDRARMRRMLEKLEDAKQIEQHPSTKNTIITIINWSTYQTDEHQVNIKRTSDEHQVNTNKNNNNNKNIISSAFAPEFFEGVISEPQKNLPEEEPLNFRNSKDPILETAENRAKTVHAKLAASGNYVAPECLVIEYFNKVNNKNLKQVDSNYREIRARVKEGFTVDEMKALIDHAAKVWSIDAFWGRLNRPSTLFNGKFNQYLEEAQNANKGILDDEELRGLKAREFYKSKFGHYPIESSEPEKSA